MKNQKRQKQKEYFFYAIIAGVTSIYIEIIAIVAYMYEQESVVDFPEPEYWIFFAAISIAAFIAFILILHEAFIFDSELEKEAKSYGNQMEK